MKKLLAITVTSANLALAGWMFWCRPAPQAPTATTALSPQPPDAAVSTVCPPQTEVVPAPAPALASQAFHWSQVESPDYRTYLRNLRAIGCPETTIRDVITADLHALYQERRRQARCPEPAEFWRGEFGLALLSQTNLARLDAEEKAVLAALLGPEANDATATAQATRLVRDLRLCGILEPKRAALEEWSQRFEFAKAALLAITDLRDLTEAEVTQLRTLETEQEQALGSLLTPDERAEFDARNSASAQYLRQTLLGLDVNESEFRQLLVARQDFDIHLTAAEAGDDAFAAHQTYQESVAKLLGAERFARFERAQDAEFQEFFKQGIASGLDARAIEAQWTEAQSQFASGLGEP